MVRSILCQRRLFQVGWGLLWYRLAGDRGSCGQSFGAAAGDVVVDTALPCWYLAQLGTAWHKNLQTTGNNKLYKK